MPHIKSLANTLPDDPVCECDTSPRKMLDEELAALQEYLDKGGCLRTYFLHAGLMGLIGTAMLAVDEAGGFGDLASPTAGLEPLRNSLVPHITPDLVHYTAQMIADMWAAPVPEARN